MTEGLRLLFGRVEVGLRHETHESAAVGDVPLGARHMSMGGVGVGGMDSECGAGGACGAWAALAAHGRLGRLRWRHTVPLTGLARLERRALLAVALALLSAERRPPARLQMRR